MSKPVTDSTSEDHTVQETEETPIQNTEEAQATLARLKAAATKDYSLKNYAAASESYSQASELQMQLNGEMSLDNADLLYQYGRCLYHLGVSKSDVLGNKVASSKEPQKKRGKKSKAKVASSEKTSDATNQKLPIVEEESTSTENKPFFQITGDENWTDSEDDDAEDAEGDGEEEEEDDDFAIAYEILDIARVLLTRKLETLPHNTYDGKGKGKEDATSLVEHPEARQVMDRLADTHDLQAELSLENENFPEAVAEGRAALELKQKLYPLESSLLAEAHFKLALAMEFASVTTTNEEAVAQQGAQKEEIVDEELRKEAATHMEAAIQSCRLRIEKEQASLPTLAADKQDAKKREIKDVSEMIADMEQRVSQNITCIPSL
jgi:HAT1-interacting factor 1